MHHTRVLLRGLLWLGAASTHAARDGQWPMPGGDVRFSGYQELPGRMARSPSRVIPLKIGTKHSGGPVENWSHSDAFVRLKLPVGISYDSDVRKAIELMEEVAVEFDRILKDPPPRCLLKGYGDSALNLELRVWVDDPQNGVSNIKSEIYLRIHDMFLENDSHFPYPQRDTHLKGPLEIQVEKPNL